MHVARAAQTSASAAAPRRGARFSGIQYQYPLPIRRQLPYQFAIGLGDVGMMGTDPIGPLQLRQEETLSSSHGPGHALRLLVRKRDFYAGGLMILFGLIMSLKGPTYQLGTLMHMGPGFLPTALGVVLICLGVTIAATATTVPEGEDEDILPPDPQWFAWACILASPIAFIIFGSYGGLAPGTFACVFVAALGDKKATWVGSILLSLLITVFGVLLFHFVLQIPMPVLKLFGWSIL